MKSEYFKVIYLLRALNTSIIHPMFTQRVSHDYLSVTQLAERWNLSIAAILQWINDGYFPGAYKAGPGKTSPWRIPLEDVLAFGRKHGFER